MITILMAFVLAWPAHAGITGGLRWRGCVPVLAAAARAGTLSVEDETREFANELRELGIELRNDVCDGLHASTETLTVVREGDIDGLRNEVRRLLIWGRSLAEKRGLGEEARALAKEEGMLFSDYVRAHGPLFQKLLGDWGGRELRHLAHWTHSFELKPYEYYLAVIGEKNIVYHRLIFIESHAWENKFWIDEGIETAPEIIEGDRPLLPHEKTTAEFLLHKHRQSIQAIVDKTDGTRSVGDVRIGESELRELKALLRENADSERVVKVVLESMANGGQSPLKTIDARGSGLAYEDAKRGLGRLAGKLREAPGRLSRLRSLEIIGDEFDVSVEFISEAEHVELERTQQLQSALQRDFDVKMQNNNPFPARLDVFVPEPVIQSPHESP